MSNMNTKTKSVQCSHYVRTANGNYFVIGGRIAMDTRWTTIMQAVRDESVDRIYDEPIVVSILGDIVLERVSNVIEILDRTAQEIQSGDADGGEIPV